jgi:hypothetical protein
MISLSRSSLPLCLAVAAALAASAAQAQTTPTRRAKTPASKPAAVKPLPAATTAPAEAVPAAAPVPVSLQPVLPPPSAPAAAPRARSGTASLLGQRWQGDLLLGVELANGESAVKLRADLETELLPLARKVVLTGLVSLGLFHWGDDTSLTIAGITTSSEASSDRLELVPSLRARFAAAPRLTLHADAGLGLSFTRTAAEVRVAGSSQSQSDSAAGGLLRFGLGGSYEVSERVRISAEVLGLNFHYGQAHGRSVTLLAGAGYRF